MAEAGMNGVAEDAVKCCDSCCVTIHSDGSVTHESGCALDNLRRELDEAIRLLDGFVGVEPDGQLCSCEVAIGNPNYRGIHTPHCNEVSKFLKEYRRKHGG